jgi:glycosyltransferase involved in cell wall biosynthesis
VTLRTLAPRPGEALADGASGPQTIVHRPAARLAGRRLARSPELAQAVRQDFARQDVVHTHGLWLMPNVYPAWALSRPDAKAKLVHSPRGMLGAEALKFSAWRKRIAWYAMQRAAIAGAHCIHATARSEYQEVRAAGLANPVAIIPNGIDIPARPDRMARGADPSARTVLSLGRIHPKKGLDRLIRAWANLAAEFPDWTLRIAGPAERGHDEELQQLAAGLGAERVSIEPAVTGAAKSQAFAEADLFVLPSLNENFAMTVAEALAHGIPVISTKGAPWAGLAANECGWWIDHGPEPMAATLRAALSMPGDKLAAMGERGRAWMARDFGWDRIAREMAGVYAWLAKGEPAPDCVRFD